MAERARLIEGLLTVDTREPRGTVVSVTVGGARPEPAAGRHTGRHAEKASDPGRVLQR